MVLCILDIFFDLFFFLFCSWVIEFSFEQIVVDYCQEVCVDGVFFVMFDFVDGCVYIVINILVWYVVQYVEGVIMGVEQYFMGLQQVGVYDECLVVIEFEMCDLQFGLNFGDDCLVFILVKLESFFWCE